MLKRCGDLNSEFCPCILAETNRCEYCTRLQGKDYCECHWSGKCPLYEKYWLERSGRTLKKNLRPDFTGTILSRRAVGAQIYLYEIAVPDVLAEKLHATGSFVFLRCPDDPREARFPVGVMGLEASRLTLAVEAVGVKTQRFVHLAKNEIIVTGPYFNGILGSPWIDNLEFGNVLLIAGGSGQAPAVSIAQKLSAHNEMTCLLSAGKSGVLFALPYLKKLLKKEALFIIDSLPDDGMELLEKLWRRKWDLIVSAGPDGQHGAVIRFFKEKGVNVPMAATNNAVMCCGEGLCGSCRKTLKSGHAVRMCKAQVDYDEIQNDF